jgi:hypothetical protein
VKIIPKVSHTEHHWSCFNLATFILFYFILFSKKQNNIFWGQNSFNGILSEFLTLHTTGTDSNTTCPWNILYFNFDSEDPMPLKLNILEYSGTFPLLNPLAIV